MFNNLIESNSHTREFKRRGSFFLFTVGAYVLLFAVAGVASIYAYDAHLDEQTDEIVTMLVPADFPITPKDIVREAPHVAKKSSSESTLDERKAPVASINTPLPPATVSTKPNPELPVRDGHPFIITGRDRNGDLNGPVVSGPPSGSNNGPAVVRISEMPPPPPVIRKPIPTVLRKNVINGEAIELPKPPYPSVARQAGISGAVNVQVLIDESGKVVSAHAVSGNPLLSPDAVRAAYRARFSPTKIGDQPVKVSGVITYNFLLN